MDIMRKRTTILMAIRISKDDTSLNKWADTTCIVALYFFQYKAIM